MANETTNYKFTKPAANEYYDVEVQNQNWDKVDETLNAKVNYSDVVNNCVSTDTNKPLSANQGKVLMDGKLAKTGDASNVTNAFSQASTRANLSTGEKLSVSLGKLMKWFADLKNVAFSGNASDLTQDSTHRMVTDTEKSTWSGKVTSSGGDIQNTKVGAFTASTASWPIPAAGETVKVILGKIVKYFQDLNSWRSTVALITNIVNNCTSTDTNKPLSANQGKVLMDGKAPKSHASTATTYGPGSASNYGHVKVSDNYTSSAGAASAGVAASSKAVADAYAKLNSDKQNKIKNRGFNPSYSSNVVGAGTTTTIWVRQWGAVVHVHFYIKLATTCNKTYTTYLLATGLPAALYSCQSGAMAIDDEKADNYTEVTTAGALNLLTRSTNMAGKIFVGGFTYIASSDTW